MCILTQFPGLGLDPGNAGVNEKDGESQLSYWSSYTGSPVIFSALFTSSQQLRISAALTLPLTSAAIGTRHLSSPPHPWCTTCP